MPDNAKVGTMSGAVDGGPSTSANPAKVGPGTMSLGAFGSAFKGLTPFLGYGVGAAALAASLFLGKGATAKTPVATPITTADPAANTDDALAPTPEQNNMVSGLTGVSNSQNPFGQLIRVFGENVRLKPVHAMIPYKLPSGADIYSYACLDLGYGPLQISDLRIGTRSISEFTDLSYQIRYGAANDAPFTIPLRDINSKDLSIPLTYLQAKTVRAGAASTKLALEITFPQGLWDSNNTAPSVKEAFTVNFTIRYKRTIDAAWTTDSFTVTDNVQVSKTYLKTITLTKAGIYDVEVTRTTGDLPFPPTYVAGTDYCEWTSLKAYGGLRSSSPNLATLLNAPVSAKTPGPATSISLDLDFTQGLYAEPLAAPGTQAAYSCTFLIEYKLTYVDAWSSFSQNITLNTGVETIQPITWAVPVRGIYDVRITRTAGDTVFPNGAYLSGRAGATWSALRAIDDQSPPFNDIFDSRGNLVRCAQIAMQVKQTSEQSGALEDLNCLATSILRRWDGSQWAPPAASSHPPDIVLEILTGQGAYQPIPDEQIDLDSFREWSIECFKKGWTYKKVIDQGVDMIPLIDEVCAAGRAALVQINGKLSIVCDKRVSKISQHFTLRNIIRDSFVAQASLGRTPKVIYAQYLDETQDYQQTEIDVYDDGYDITNVDNDALTISFPGSTTYQQVYKRARWIMANTRELFWNYTFRTTPAHLACKVGDRVRVAHDAVMLNPMQGRITALNLNNSGALVSISIDAEIEMQSGKDYAAYVIASDGTEIHLDLVDTTGTTKTLALLSPLPAGSVLPYVGTQVIVGELGYESLDCRIVDITIAEDFTAQITCTDYIDSLYDIDDQPIPAYTPRIRAYTPTVINVNTPTVTSIATGNDALVVSGGRQIPSILIGLMGEASPIRYYEGQVKPSSVASWDGVESTLSLCETLKLRLLGVEQGQSYDVRIRNRTNSDQVSAWLNIATNLKIEGKLQPPPDVPQIIDRLAGTKMIRWYYDLAHGVVVPLDHAGFKIKIMSGDSDDWDHAQTVADAWQGTTFDFSAYASGLKSIMIKAVDTSGIEQTGPAAIIRVEFGDPETANIVESVTLSPDYTGVDITSGTITDPIKFFPANLASPWFPATLSAPWFTFPYLPGSGFIGADEGADTFFPANLSNPWFLADLSQPWIVPTFDSMRLQFEIFVPEKMSYPAKILLDLDATGAYTAEYRLKEVDPMFPANLSDPWFPANLANSWFAVSNPAWSAWPDAGLTIYEQDSLPVIQYRLSELVSMFPANLAAPMFPANLSDPWLAVEVPIFAPLPPQGIDTKTKRLEFRINFVGGYIRAVLRRLGYIFDVPDKEEYIDDLVVTDPAGYYLQLKQDFRKIKRISVTPQLSPDYPNARSALPFGKDGPQPLIKVFDAAGNATTGKVDVIVRGY